MKRVPELKTDAEAEAFLEQDLSNLDFKQFKPMRFEIAKKRLPCICACLLSYWTRYVPRPRLKVSRTPAMCGWC